MAIEESIEYGASTRVVQDAAAGLARRDTEATSAMDFRRAWMRDLGRLAREHQDDDWVISAYAVQIIRQLQGRLPIG